MKHSLPLFIGAVGLLVGNTGCEDTGLRKTEDLPQRTKPEVWVTNYPLNYFTTRLAGDLATVIYKAPSDEDPAFWKPSDEDLSGFQRADLIISNGATYEKWAATASLPEEKVIDTSAGFSTQFIETKDGSTHSHGNEGAHSHGGTAFTTWIDFKQAIEQANAVRGALAKLCPQGASAIDERFAALQSDLASLDGAMVKAAKAAGGRPLMASHPIYQYWARRYGLNVATVLWEPETVPDDAAMDTLQKILKDHPATLMIWEDTPDPASVAKLKAIGVSSVVFAPTANTPDSGDFLSAMQTNIQQVEQAFATP